MVVLENFRSTRQKKESPLLSDEVAYRLTTALEQHAKAAHELTRALNEHTASQRNITPDVSRLCELLATLVGTDSQTSLLITLINAIKDVGGEVEQAVSAMRQQRPSDL